MDMNWLDNLIFKEDVPMESQRIALEVKPIGSIEVDSSSGNLYLEAAVLIAVVAVVYVGKKIIDKMFK